MKETYVPRDFCAIVFNIFWIISNETKRQKKKKEKIYVKQLKELVKITIPEGESIQSLL